MAFYMNIHGYQLHPKVAICVVKQLKNDSFRQGLQLKNISYSFQDGHMTSIDDTNSAITGLKSEILDAFVVGFSYLASDFNIWDYPMTIADMKLWTSCR